MAIGELLLGWSLGLMSPVIVDRFTERRRQKELKRAIGIELRDLQYTVTLVAYRLHKRCGSVTAERMALFKQVVEAYNGPEEDPKGRVATRAFFALQWPEQEAMLAQQQETTFNTPRMAKYQLPFVTAHMQDLRSSPINLQWRLAQVLRDLQLYNDHADYCGAQLERTFDVSITGVNRSLLQSNIESAYHSAAMRSERIVSEIRDLLNEYSKAM
jgi:hypothetical protein